MSDRTEPASAWAHRWAVAKLVPGAVALRCASDGVSYDSSMTTPGWDCTSLGSACCSCAGAGCRTVRRNYLVEDAQEAVDRTDRQQHRDAGEREDRQPLERLRAALLALALTVEVERFLRTLLNGPLQLRLRAFEGQDACAGASPTARLPFRAGVLRSVESLEGASHRRSGRTDRSVTRGTGRMTRRPIVLDAVPGRRRAQR